MRIEELEKCIDLEIVKTEKRRLEIFLGLVFAGLLILLANIFFFPIALSEVFLDPRSINLGIYISIGFGIELLLSRAIVCKIVTCERPLPNWYLVCVVLLESLMPAIWLFFIIKWERNAAFLDSPMVFIYIPMLIVSALHLSFWLSFLNGLLIAVLFSTISYWAHSLYSSELFLPPIVYHTKSILFLLSGVSAGLVARELKKRLTMSVTTQEEKEEIETMFSQQVSKQVVSALKSSPNFSNKEQATVLFLDIRDFTKRVQNMSLDEVNKFQNKFFGPIIECVGNHNGVINQLLGDGLMATFGLAEDQKHEERTFRAAIDILDRLEISNRSMDTPIKIGIGIHSGEVIAGNIGTEERQQFSISGIPVITAARLEQMTKEYNCSLLVSFHFYEKIKHLAVNGSSLGNVKMKGLDHELEIIKLR